MKNDFYFYEDIRQMAISEGIADNRVSIGIWAKMRGWKNTKKQIKRKKHVVYWRDSDMQIMSGIDVK